MDDRPATFFAGNVRVEVLDIRSAAANYDEWMRLSSRSLDRNPFFEPEFMLPAVGRLLGPQRPRILVARKRCDGRIRMVGLLPLAPIRHSIGFVPIKGWRNELMPIGAPLLDRECAAETLSALLAWIDRFEPRNCGLLLHSVPTDGPTASVIRSVTSVRELDPRERAAILTEKLGADRSSPSRRRKLARLRRRLGEQGNLAFRMLEYDEVPLALERFLDLEASGWKGSRGTALRNNLITLGVARAFTQRLSAQRRCMLAILELDEILVAAGIILISGPLAAYWKTAYNEYYSKYSPGALIADDISRLLLERADIEVIDSCTIPNHPLFDGLWASRIQIADLLLGGRNVARTTLSSRQETYRRAIRNVLKDTYLRVTGRKRV